MTLHLHHLTGCAPTPLAHYLKALGILRLVAEQKDEGVRGWWQDEHFCLLTTVDRESLERFFLTEYGPTPFVSPWNKGAGFFKPQDKGLAPIEQSVARRLVRLRDGVAAARVLLQELQAADGAVRRIKDETKPTMKGMSAAEKARVKREANALREDPVYKRRLAEANRRFAALKGDVFAPLARAWRGPHREWMEAAVVLPEEGAPMFPSLLGTGGNDGNLDFTNNAMQRLGEMFDLADPDARPRPQAEPLLRNALWQMPCPGYSESSVGQFLPGTAGGANSTSGASGDALVNPWDFVLMMEGAVLFGARASRRLGALTRALASAPFAVHAHGVGYATAGNEKAERGEQWMPIWSSPSSLRDLAAMLGEARLQLGRRTVQRPVDAARAVSRLGVARGVTGFERFGYLERNGQSTFAVPLGRVQVRELARSRLVDDVGPWLDRLQQLARAENAPARLVQAEHRLGDAVFGALVHHDEPGRWQAILLAAVAVEEVQRGGAAIQAGPIPSLSTGWLEASDDGTAEWRLAMALGSAAGLYDRRGRPVDPVRQHWLPLEDGARRLDVREKRLAQSPRVVITGRDPVGDCIALVGRRLIEATAVGQRRLPLVAPRGCAARLDDVAQFLSGGVDLSRVVALGRALMAVRWDQEQESRAPSPAGSQPDEAWMALRLAHLPGSLSKDRSIATDAAIVRRLASGDAASAVELALRRLRAAGLRPPLVAATANVTTARLWGAALVFPIDQTTARAIARRFAATNELSGNQDHQ